MSLPGWVHYSGLCPRDAGCELHRGKLIEALSIALEALEQSKKEFDEIGGFLKMHSEGDLPRDKYLPYYGLGERSKDNRDRIYSVFSRISNLGGPTR